MARTALGAPPKAQTSRFNQCNFQIAGGAESHGMPGIPGGFSHGNATRQATSGTGRRRK